MANETTNYGFVMPTADEFYDVEVQNSNWDNNDTILKAHATQLSESVNILSLITGSTSNAILLNISTLINNKKYSFKANANSTGNVTINGKAFKKLDGTQIGSGGVKINKVYDFYYSSSDDCVFILAKAVGTATVADVLAPKTFSNGDDIELTGGIPSKTAQTYKPTTTDQVISAGQYLSEPQTIKGYPDLVASNIVKNKVIGDVIGSYDPLTLVAGDSTIIYNDTTVSNATSTSYTPIKGGYIKNQGGTIRVSFTFHSTSVTYSYARIYVNGVAKGIERTADGTPLYTFTEDITINAGDLVQLYGRSNNTISVTMLKISVVNSYGTIF